MLSRTKANVSSWIYEELGRGVVDVELTSEQVDRAIDAAMNWWQTFVGQCKATMLVLTGSNEYDVSLIGNDVDSIVEVVFEGYSDDIWNMFKWADVEVNLYDHAYSPHGGYSAVLQYMQYREMSRQIMSADRDWEWDRGRGKLILTPRPSAGTRASVVYISRSVELEYLTNYEFDIFRKYAKSQAMQTLGAIRRKYAGLPSATGEFTLDGDALYAEGRDLEKDMEEKAMQLEEPVGFFAG